MSWTGFGKEFAWSLKTPIALGVATGVGVYGIRELARTEWMKEQLAAAKAADEAYAAELLRAYKFAYPEDTNVTQAELSEFAQTYFGLTETFRESNFEHQNHIYEKMMELYGSPQGTLHETAVAAQMNLGEFVLGVSIAVTALTALFAVGTLVRAPFAAKERADWRQP